MLRQVKFSSLKTFPKIPFSDKPFVNTTGVELPGITEETQKCTLELLEELHKNNDIFFNDKHLHDHSVHHILAAYSCGASSEVLRNIAKYSSKRPKLPSKVKITLSNWQEHLGDYDMYTDYLAFFEELIAKDGVHATFEKYTFHKDMFPKLFTGALHPIIHLGYGIEFQIPMIVAQALAETAIHANRYKNLIDEDYLSYKGTEQKKIIDIIQDVQKDSRFDVLHYEDNGKLDIILQKALDPLKEVIRSWTIKETEEDLLKATQEHFEAIALLFGATAIRKDKEELAIDFFLMHALTSVLLLYSILPYVDLDKKIRLLRGHFAATMAEYIARGRPHLDIDALRNFTPKKLNSEPNPWLDIIKLSILEEKESHVIKTVRSLLKAEHEWGSGTDNLYAKIGQLVYEAYEIYGFNDDIGFEESWDGSHKH